MVVKMDMQPTDWMKHKFESMRTLMRWSTSTKDDLIFTPVLDLDLLDPISWCSNLEESDCECFAKALNVLPAGRWQQRRSPLFPKRREEIPSSLQLLLSECEDIRNQTRNLSQAQSQLEVLLVLLLVAKKRAESARSDSSPSPAERLHWSLENQVTMPYLKDETYCMAEGQVDYVLWYGAWEELETNLVVSWTGGDIDEPPFWNLVGNMAKIHWARRETGRQPCIIYGIMTDGAKWTFVYINPKGRYTTRVMHWANDQGKVITKINHILDEASTLAATASNCKSPLQMSVGQSSGCAILDVLRSSGDSEEERDPENRPDTEKRDEGSWEV